MNVKELLIKFQEYQLEYEVLNANCAHNAAANLFMERYGIKNCFIPDVVGRSEQLVCPHCNGAGEYLDTHPERYGIVKCSCKAN